MKIAIGKFNGIEPKKFKFTRQLGVKNIIVNTPKLPGNGWWEYEDLNNFREQIESYGLKLGAIENIPKKFYDKVMLGLPGRDEQIENIKKTIINMGKASIPILGYNWMPNGVWRTTREKERNYYSFDKTGFDFKSVKKVTNDTGALVTYFDYELVKNVPPTHNKIYTEEEMWENYTYFIKRIVPTAEKAKVKLALHPDDPPVMQIGGIARIFRNLSAFKRAINIVDSDFHGLDFCQGCWSEMGEDVIKAIKYFGKKKKIIYVHLRSVKGTVPRFIETLIDQGNIDIFEAIMAYKEIGFKGMIMPDHTPQLEGDNDPYFEERGRAYSVGYISALIKSVNKIAGN